MTTKQHLENTYNIARCDVNMWAKAEHPIFKQVEDYVKRLEHNKETFTIGWLANKHVVVTTKHSIKDFYYLNSKD
jgi:hypothetical protein